MERIHSSYLFDPDLNAGKMIFLSGPRQIGKTTFVLSKLKALSLEHLYFNWDDPHVRREYIRNPHFLKAKIAAEKAIPLIAFDEIHKHKQWKDILKGLYDIHREQAQFIITGSARLDFFRQSGDSLIGRYFSYRMLPLGMSEAMGEMQHVVNDDMMFSNQGNEAELITRLHDIPGKKAREVMEQLAVFGGFPEPFLKANTRFSNKWRRDYKSLLLYEDLRDLSRIQDIKGVEQLVLMLPERVGSPLSINSLREDLQVNHATVSNWIEALKKIYLVFSILPWSRHISKAIKRETKVYFFDWALVSDSAKRLENMVAVSLLRLVCRWNELGLGDFDLRYVRNQQGKEVDFVIIKDQQPLLMFEVKESERKPAKAGTYFQKHLHIPYFQVVGTFDGVEAFPNRQYVIAAWRLLSLIG
jgi:predicted AAA+ superfamily ATPase